MLDIRIDNAVIVDGTGAPARNGSVGIRDGRIAAVGDVGESAKRTVDAGGLVAAPGFVDVHTHYDAQVFWDHTVSPSCYHGVTTVFGGHCGFSIAPLNEEAAPYLLRMLARVEGMPVPSLEQGVPWNWKTFGEYLGKLDGNLGVNAGFMAGHSAIRRVVMGEGAVGAKASDKELEQMQQLLAESIEQGALGWSSTVSPTHNDAEGQPVPSRHADRRELLAFAEVCGRYPGTSIEFLPGVGMFSDETKQLMSDLSTTAGRPVNWNVLVAGDPKLMENQLDASDVARANGGKVVALTVPQPVTLRINLFGGFVFDALDGWAELFELPVDERMVRLRDADYRVELDAMAQKPGPFKQIADWANMSVHSAFDDANKHLEGRMLGDIAREQGKKPIDVMFDLALSEGLRTSFMPPAFGGGADPALWDLRGRLWTDNRTIIGASDAGAHLDMIDTFAFSTQVLGNGVREYGVISLEEGVHQITQVPAELFGLKERGVLKEGWHADVVLFDPETVGTGPVYFKSDLPADEPRIYADAVGVRDVFVNGTQIVADGAHTGALPGKALRSGTDTDTPSLEY